MNRRDQQIAEINARVADLRKDRLEVCRAQILKSYAESSNVDKLAQVIELMEREPSDFRVITNQETRRLSHFNDPSYYWDMYCEQFGRSVALGERRYVFEKVAELPPSDLVVAASDPSFGVIEEAVERVKRAGHQPNVLFAPISLMVPFNSDPALRIDWHSHPREALVMGDGTRLPLMWSSSIAPLNRFVVADANAGVWKVKLDPQTGHRLTVAIGRPESPPEAVVFLAETVVKYKIEYPEAFCVIDVGGHSDDEERSEEMPHA